MVLDFSDEAKIEADPRVLLEKNQQSQDRERHAILLTGPNSS
jgi:hypothetical protein